MWPRIIRGIFFLMISWNLEARHFAYDPVTEITYPRGEKEVSHEAKEKLAKLFQASEGRGNIKKVKVLTWGDLEYPSIHSRKDSLLQTELAVERNQSLLHYLEGLAGKKTNIQFLSMAERSSAINRFLEGENESTRKSLELVGIPNTDTSVKVPEKASKSIVIFIMEE